MKFKKKIQKEKYIKFHTTFLEDILTDISQYFVFDYKICLFLV